MKKKNGKELFIVLDGKVIAKAKAHTLNVDFPLDEESKGLYTNHKEMTDEFRDAIPWMRSKSWSCEFGGSLTTKTVITIKNTKNKTIITIE
jgi:hypothetical protein